jgi:tRNA(Ile)-lysidine synthase TilS/MesJ
MCYNINIGVGFMERYQEIERSIIKKYRKEIWSKFVKAVQDYELIKENDNIMVCISGGKDSFLLAKCIQELQRHGKVKFDAHYVTMNPGYNEYNREMIIKNAEALNIPLEMFETNIFDVVAEIDSKVSCYLCARMRRGNLYSKAQELGCNKIALGHHFDDVIETTLLSMFYGSEIKTMMPKLHSENFEGLELIRPMYLIKEEDIISWKNNNDLTFINCACRFTESCAVEDDGISKRKEMKNLIKNLRKINKNVDHNIFKSMDNINLNCVLGTKKNGEYKSFLEEYDKRS